MPAASRIPLILLIWLLAGPVLAAGKVQEFTLDNGMQVLVKEDHRAPVAVSQVWYRVGGSYEHAGQTGLSHLLEHMMFRGTDSVGPGEFSRIIAGLGGTENAFTGRDYTTFYETLSVQHLARALQLEADRMRGLRLDRRQFARELQVVREERRLRTDDRPTGLLYEQLMAVAWRASPYRNPVIGWSDDLAYLRLEQVRDWYRRWYAPNNAVLVVVGDVDPQRVLALARKAFGPIPRARVERPRPIIEPRQRGLTRVQVEVPAQQPALVLGYKVPVIGRAREKWEPYALYVLAAVLGGGDSARLDSRLVRGSGVAAAVGAHYDGYSRLPTLFILSGTPAPGHTSAQLEQALRAQVRELRAQLIGPEELQRVIAQMVAAKVYQADSMFHQATELGGLASIGLDWHLLEQELAAIRAVTPEQVRAVARRYLVDDNLTIAELVPRRPGRPAGESPLRAPPAGSAHPGRASVAARTRTTAAPPVAPQSSTSEPLKPVPSPSPLLIAPPRRPPALPPAAPASPGGELQHVD